MMNWFNDFGAVQPSTWERDNELAELGDRLRKEVAKFFAEKERMAADLDKSLKRETGPTTLEIRAAGQHLCASVSCAVAEALLRKQTRMRKQQQAWRRSKEYKDYVRDFVTGPAGKPKEKQ
jgi:exonuclease VII large subunit